LYTENEKKDIYGGVPALHETAYCKTKIFGANIFSTISSENLLAQIYFRASTPHDQRF
jgi:hypothetical protein